MKGYCVVAGCPDRDRKTQRKVISHYFGRNKASTMNLPSAIYMPMCRKHYQRVSYRDKQRGRFCTKQAVMVENVFKNLKQRDIEVVWTICPSKALKDALDEDNARRVSTASKNGHQLPPRSRGNNVSKTRKNELSGLEAQLDMAILLMDDTGDGKTTDECLDFLWRLHKLSERDDMPDQLIHFEFLPQTNVHEEWAAWHEARP